MFKSFSISRSLYYIFVIVFYIISVFYFVILLLYPVVLGLFPIANAIILGESKILVTLIATLPVSFLVANVLWSADVILMPFKVFDRFYYNKNIKGWEL